MTILLELFWAFFQVGLFSIGGGYAAIGVIEQQAVDKYSWLTRTEYLDLITIAEMTPGPITLNSATFVGTRVAGLGGAIIATIASILPGIIIVSFLAYLYYRYQKLEMVQGILAGLRPAIVAIIAAAALNIVLQTLWSGGLPLSLTAESVVSFLGSINIIALVLFIIAMVVLVRWEPNPVFVIIASGVVGGAVYLAKDFLFA